MGTGPIPASKKALEKAGWRVKDLDLIEANEAFAAQACAVNKGLGWDTAKVNVNGGAIAIGHPIGASGARVLNTLLFEMQRRDAKKGLATLCIGGGMGVAMCVAAPLTVSRRTFASPGPCRLPGSSACHYTRSKRRDSVGRIAHGSSCGRHGRNARHRRGISRALKAKGYRSRPHYAGNDTAAQRFQAETGIPVYKFDVGDYAACEQGVAQITARSRAGRRLVNNAGITRDGMLHRMTLGAMGRGVAHQPRFGLQHDAGS